ncbi:hypothetical protein I2W78_37670 [Streptomyces spinoverrucosus]|uniref:hypothetical protein n=1 Tax=Streptomyces spinoverrucosus TaxID=284043 RepID=UPI0018C415B1|nr:hypothetical protein [Streptomyces spinoverrucosus]MBG0857424.1 hypothetical protein [Streptomyces spinoverrucosus]
MTRSGTARALIRLLAAAPLVLTAVACSSPPAPAPSPDQASVRPGDLELPAGTRALLADAERALVQDCMARQGFSFFYDSTDPAELRAETARRYWDLTLDDVPRSRREGFGPAADSAPLPASRAERQEQAYLAQLPPQRRAAWADALMGPSGQDRIKVDVPGVGIMEHPTAGCFAQARTRLFGDYEKWLRADTFVHARFRPVEQAVTGSPEYREATARWSTCVKGRGHAFATPEDARARASALSRDQAIALAVATAVCDRQVGRSETHRSLYEQATVDWIERHPTQAADFRRLNAEAARRLTTLTTAPDPVPDTATATEPVS